MQAEIWADDAVEKLVNNAGLTENLAFRSGKKTLSETTQLLVYI